MRLMISFLMLSLIALARGAEPDTKPALSALLNRDKMKPRGTWTETKVPDTLDLAQRAELSLNVLLGNVEPAKQYSVYQGFDLRSRPLKPGALTWNIQHKNARALPLMRAMTGSERGLDLEYEIMKNALSQLDANGLIYFPIGGENVPEGTSDPAIIALVMLAMENWYQRDPNPAWLEWMGLLRNGFERLSLRSGDRVYFPPESGMDRQGQWHFSARSDGAITPYKPPEEPVMDYQGAEGCIKCLTALPMRALLKYYKYSHDPKALEMAVGASHFVLKPSLWMNTGELGYAGDEHGLFQGHFHGNIMTLHALLDLALTTHNPTIEQFVREAYDHARRIGVAHMGFFPCWYLPEKCDRDYSLASLSETCGISDMVLLAVKMSDAGMGDYWDDVDAWVHNQLSEDQFVDLDQMRRIAGNKPENDEVLKRYLGGFGSGEPTSIPTSIYGCCTANGAIGLYYAWHGITRFENGIAQVNLLLNRASPWMDIYSYIPYEGKVVLRNKQARAAHVRIPAWIDADKITSTINNKPAHPTRLGNQLIFEGLRKKDVIGLEFPLEERTETRTIFHTKYKIAYRGSTIMDIEPRKTGADVYSIYRRAGMRQGPAPMHAVRRFIADRLPPLQ